MQYDKAKARLGIANDQADDPAVDTIVSVLTQALETLEIIERMVYDLNREVKTIKGINQGGIQ